MFRDVKLSLVFLVELVGFLSKKEGSESLGSEDTEDHSGANEDEENPVYPTPSVGFFGDPASKQWTETRPHTVVVRKGYPISKKDHLQESRTEHGHRETTILCVPNVGNGTAYIGKWCG